MSERLDERAVPTEVPYEEPAGQPTPASAALGVVLVVGLALLVYWLSRGIPTWSEGSALEGFVRPIEFPVYPGVAAFLCPQAIYCLSGSSPVISLTNLAFHLAVFRFYSTETSGHRR